MTKYCQYLLNTLQGIARCWYYVLKGKIPVKEVLSASYRDLKLFTNGEWKKLNTVRYRAAR